MTDYFGTMGTAIYSRLVGGTALISALGGSAVYAEQAPDLSELPYVVFSHQGGGPRTNSGTDLREGLWFVRAYSEQGSEAAEIDGLLEDLLDKIALSVSGWDNIWLRRESDFSLVETTPNNEKIFMRGGSYRITVSK